MNYCRSRFLYLCVACFFNFNQQFLQGNLILYLIFFDQDLRASESDVAENVHAIATLSIIHVLQITFQTTEKLRKWLFCH